jgi:peptidoglycan-associated lipoprotein
MLSAPIGVLIDKMAVCYIMEKNACFFQPKKGVVMKNLRILVLFYSLIFLAGCQCPKTAREKFLDGAIDGTKKEEVKPSALSIFTQDIEPINPVTPGTTVKTHGSGDAGKATAYETQQATKGQPIPLQPIPEGKVFKSPSDISPELAEIFKRIYFNYDRYDIRTADVQVLTKIGRYLLEKPNMEVLIEGHCDERGTREYNLVLGEQRALSTRRFLVELGVSPKRLYTVSYGKDMPADTRSNEDAWAKNRRADFKIAE